MDHASSTYRAQTRYSTSYNGAGYALGFAMGGFFDGILLHQVLQWHHLLSGVRSARFADLRVQIMADGLFHAVMYIVAIAGLYMLYRARADLSLPRGARRLAANFWIGFGTWHVLDAVLSHWVTRIHRIRMDSTFPLAWDLAWLVAFGLLPLVVGWWLRRRADNAGPGPGDGHRTGRGRGRGLGRGGKGIALGLIGACLLGGSMNLFPLRPNGSTITVVLRPGANPARMLAALEDTRATVAWSDRSGAVWVLAGDDGLDAWRFYRHGAMYVGGPGAPAGCSAWITTGNAEKTS